MIIYFFGFTERANLLFMRTPSLLIIDPYELLILFHKCYLYHKVKQLSLQNILEQNFIHYMENLYKID